MNQDMELINRWKQAKTGMPLIDALMRELNTSGYLREQGFEILATYFTRDLRLDWRFGAAHF
jgi:deoxyribodipyrimidine photo-lyase